MVAIALLLFGISATVQAPRDVSTPAPGASVIRGRVVADDTGEALRRVHVLIAAGTNVRVEPVLTDNEGRFAFTNVPPGAYTLSTKKPGFTATRYGARGPSAVPARIEVAATTVVAGIEVRMPRSAVISGRIVDQFGDPIERALVVAEIVRSGRGSVRTAQAMTDDLGEYRLEGLPPGTFFVGATLPFAPSITMVIAMPGLPAMQTMRPSQARTYYPGVVAASEAQVITIRAGEERSSTDFPVVSARLGKLTISFIDSKGAPAAASTMLIGIDGMGLDPRMARPLFSDGPRVITDLEPGEWMVIGRGPAASGIARLSMGTDDVSITVPLVAGGRISGRVTTDGPPLPRGALLIEAASLEPALADTPFAGAFAPMMPDGTFNLRDMMGLIGPRALRVRLPLPPGWIVKAIMHKGRNLLDETIELKGDEVLDGVDVMLSNRPARLRGTVTAGGESPAGDGVLLFPENPALARHHWLPRAAPCNQNGEFAIDDLRPGAYLAVALDEVDDSQRTSPDYLNRFRAVATRVVLGDAETKTIALPLVSVR